MDWSPIKDTPRGEKYDLGIVIIPKNNPQVDINHFKTFCDKVKVMSRGTKLVFSRLYNRTTI